MKLDRNINDNRRGKYALLKLRRLSEIEAANSMKAGLAVAHIHKSVMDAIAVLEREGILDWGLAGTESEFMVIRLKDENADVALYAYANKASDMDPEYAGEILKMADRAGPNNPWCKKPD